MIQTIFNINKQFLVQISGVLKRKENMKLDKNVEVKTTMDSSQRNHAIPMEEKNKKKHVNTLMSTPLSKNHFILPFVQ